MYSIKNKRLVERNTVINGKLYGIREIYDENGYIFLRGAYLEGKKIGLWHEYENGKIKNKDFFWWERKILWFIQRILSKWTIKRRKCLYKRWINKEN